MNRRKFLKNSLAFGVAISFGNSIGENLRMKSSKSIKEIHFDGLVAVDAHSHPYHIHAEFPYGRLMHLKTTPTIDRMKNAGFVASVFAAVGDRWSSEDVPGNLFEDTMNQLERVERLEEKKKLRIIRNKSEIEFSNSEDELFGAIMAIEGGDALEGKILNLVRYYDFDVRLITLLHNHNNEIGFHQQSYSDGPLTPFGIKVVEKMNEIGMIVDVAHSNRKTLKSISEVSKLPLLDSHTGPFPEGEDNSFPSRARTWKEMEIIAKSGGVVCTMPVSYIIGKHSKTTLQDWADEIVLMKTRLGIEHVGLGTDSGGSLPGLVSGWESISSLPDLIKELFAAGLSNDDIIAFTGGNFLRIASKSFQ